MRVIDGDSFVAMVHRDMGFHGQASFLVKMRLERINAAKSTSERGANAKETLVRLVMGAVPSMPDSVHIETTGPYKYGDEWMAEVTLADGRNVSDEMVASGHAVYWTGRGPRPADD